MRTSYYGRMGSKQYKEFSKYGVCISRTSKYWRGPSYPALFPTWEIINCKDEAKYEEMYREQILSKLDPLEVYNDLGEDAILLCYESIDKIRKGETFCHRHMVARWLEEELLEQYGIEISIPELGEDGDVGNYKFDKKKYKKAEVVEEQLEFDLDI